MDKLLLKSLVKGALTYVPGLHSIAPKKGSGGGTESAEYCYGVWLKHLSFLASHQHFQMPQHVAELGPGSSLGVGYAALLSGAEKYTALDVVAHAASSNRLGVFDHLHKLFEQRTARPVKGWPDFDHLLNEQHFPDQILTGDVLKNALHVDRIATLRAELATAQAPAHQPNAIRYAAPWTDAGLIDNHELELVYSQSVLEYVDDLDECFSAQWRWLRPGGYISHQVDLSSHGITSAWDGMRVLSDTQWAIIKGKRPFGLNRLACSDYISAIERAGFEVELVLKRNAQPIATLGTPWQQENQDDAQTSGLFIQARKPEG